MMKNFPNCSKAAIKPAWPLVTPIAKALTPAADRQDYQAVFN